jgi:hypothetical protein
MPDCRSCGASVPRDEIFCLRCGAPLAPPGAPIGTTVAGRQPISGAVLERRLDACARAFFVASIALVVATVLPWASTFGVLDLSVGAIVYLLAFAAAYAYAAHAVRQRVAGLGVLVGAWVVNAWMVLNVILIFAAFGDNTGGVNPGLGVFCATFGVGSGVLATIRLHRAYLAARRP